MNTGSRTKGAWIDFDGYFLYFSTDLEVSKRGESEYEIEGQGSSLPDPLLFQKKVDPPPLRQSPGLRVENGPNLICSSSKDNILVVRYIFTNPALGERVEVEVELEGGAARNLHKRAYEVDQINATVKLIKNKMNRREAFKKIAYSPTSLDEKIDNLTNIRDSIQKEIEPYRV